MRKLEVLEFFGGSRSAAYALKVTDSAVRMWPEEIGDHLAARVIRAGIQRKGTTATREVWPEEFRRPID